MLSPRETGCFRSAAPIAMLVFTNPTEQKMAIPWCVRDGVCEQQAPSNPYQCNDKHSGCRRPFRKAEEIAVVHKSTDFLTFFFEQCPHLAHLGTTLTSFKNSFPFSPHSALKAGRKSNFFKVHVDEEDHMVVKSIFWTLSKSWDGCFSHGHHMVYLRTVQLGMN